MIEFKENMICFSGGGHFIQKAIKFFTNCDFSHSFVTMKVDGILCALETTSTIVVCKPVDEKLPEENYIECWELIDPIDTAKLVMNSICAKHSLEGLWYAYQSYIWFMYRWFMRLFNVDKKTMWSWCSKLGPFEITCTELTMYSLPERCRPSQDFNAISPKELREYVINNPDKFRLVGWINKEKFYAK